MESLRKFSSRREQAAALVIVLALAVLVTGLVLAYFSRATSDRPVAHSSFNQSKADQLAASAMDNIIGDLRQEMVNGSTATPLANGATIYTPITGANMVPQRSGNPGGVPDPVPNLVRRSWANDTNLSVRSRASAVNSTNDVSANGHSITSTRWNSHYLVPKKDTTSNDSLPIDSFTSATPDWVFVSNVGPTPSPAPAAVIGRYAYAIYDEGGLLDMNVAGYPTNTAQIQSGRKGSLAFADLKALGAYPILNGSGVYQIDRLVGWRNYGTTQPSNNFPDTAPAFAANFLAGSGPALAYWSFIINNTNGFLSTSGNVAANGRTDQAFLSRQELIAFQKTQNTSNGNPIANTSQFDPNALQYVGTFSRETNSPSFSPSTPTAINPNFLLARVTTVPSGYKRFDGSTPVVGEPLVKTRFPLSRLAWITYKGPSADVYNSNPNPPYDPVIASLLNSGVPLSTIQAGTAANIKACFGLTFNTEP